MKSGIQVKVVGGNSTCHGPCSDPIQRGEVALVAMPSSGSYVHGARFHPACLIDHVKENLLESDEAIPCAMCGDPVYDDDDNAHVLTGEIPCPDEPGGGYIENVNR